MRIGVGGRWVSMGGQRAIAPPAGSLGGGCRIIEGQIPSTWPEGRACTPCACQAPPRMVCRWGGGVVVGGSRPPVTRPRRAACRCPAGSRSFLNQLNGVVIVLLHAPVVEFGAPAQAIRFTPRPALPKFGRHHQQAGPPEGRIDRSWGRGDQRRTKTGPREEVGSALFCWCSGAKEEPAPVP